MKNASQTQHHRSETKKKEEQKNGRNSMMHSAVGIVAAGANGKVAAGWGTVNFAMPYFRYDSEN